MSEGKRTPGPFQLEAMGCVYRDDRFVLRLSDDPDNTECAEIIDLLNKGTHFDEAVRQREWQPIETAPKDGTELQLWRGAFVAASIVIGRWQKIGKGGRWEMSYGSARLDPQPSYWQPLPKPLTEGAPNAEG